MELTGKGDPTDTSRCGENRGYRYHLWVGTEPCEACIKAHAEAVKQWQYRRDLGYPSPMVDALGTHRRIQALATLGYSIQEVWRQAGINRRPNGRVGKYKRIHREDAEAIAEAYERLCMRPKVGVTNYERSSITIVKQRAAEKGWAPPLAWDNIDDPNEEPEGMLFDE
jgi:hypothetical protein